jgi:HlyD family secretion protein
MNSASRPLGDFRKESPVSPPITFRWRWLAYGLVGLAIPVAGSFYFIRPPAGQRASAAAEDDDEPPVGEHVFSVEVVRPTRGGIERTTVQPGSVQTFEGAKLFAEVSGYLKTLNVDIGDRVKRGQVLAVLDVPELEKQVEKHRAEVDQAKANLDLMKSRLASAQARWKAARSRIKQVEHAARAAKATRVFREMQYQRIKRLYASRSIEEELVDEKQEHLDAALAAEQAALEAVTTATEEEAAARARIEEARADITNAKAQVGVAQAQLDRAEVMVHFATIRSPYTGVITRRNFFPGDFIRAAGGGGEGTPLLVVERTDKMRMVVQVPDRDVPYTDPGDPADVEIDALPGVTFTSKPGAPVVVSRIQGSEDLETRMMRVEIDLPNPDGKLRQGMYGRVKIHLQPGPANVLTLPSRCLVGKVDAGLGAVFVVRDGKARRVSVRLGSDDGVRVEVLGGLKPTDLVVRRSGEMLSEGVAVAPTETKAR